MRFDKYPLYYMSIILVYLIVSIMTVFSVLFPSISLGIFFSTGLIPVFIAFILPAISIYLHFKELTYRVGLSAAASGIVTIIGTVYMIFFILPLI